MKKSKILITGLITIVITSGYFINSMAATLKPGTSQDPLVSKSYVDDKINEVMTLLKNYSSTKTETETYVVSKLSEEDMNEIVSDVVAQVEFLYKNAESSNTTKNDEKVVTQSFVPVKVSANQKIIGKEGTEIILRSGKAKSYSKTSDGLVNVTTGEDMKNGVAVKVNNLLIVPRDDGRGVSCTTESWFMVKGNYEITK